MSFSLIVFNFILCIFETMAGWIDVHAQFNGRESQRLKVRCLSVTLRGLKDQLNEFNQGVNPRDTRRVEYVRYKCPTLDDGRVSFTWMELTNDENVKSMFWEHNMFKWIDMRVTLLKSTEDIIKSLILPEDHDLVRKCTFQLQQLSSSGWGNSNLLNGRTRAFVRHFHCSFQKIKFLLDWFK